jgi:inosine triphosphate pyrophosphatase
MTPKRLTFVTGNANKLAEVRSLLPDSIELEAVKVDLPELQGTIEDISKDKARRAAALVCFQSLYSSHGSS